MSITQTSNVAARLGRPISATNEVAQVQAWIDDVEDTIIRPRIGDLAELIADERLSEATLVRVVASAVIRKIQNPEGLRTVSRALDDWQTTATRDKVLSDGQLRLTDEEWADLYLELTPTPLPTIYTLPLGGP